MVDHSTVEQCSSFDSTLLGTGKFQLLKLKALIHMGGRILCRVDLVRLLRAIFSSI